jgi:hypothetical protein
MAFLHHHLGNYLHTIIIFSKKNHSHDVTLKDNQMIYSGQTAIYNNDKFFEDATTKIYLFKQDGKQIWKFAGECTVIAQSQKRLIDKQQPILPKWILHFDIPYALLHWNDDLNTLKINGYLHKISIFEYVKRQIYMKPIHKGAHNLGIVELIEY